MVRGGTRSHLGRLQVEAAGFVQSRKDYVQQRRYLLGRFALDRFGRFFSAASKRPLQGVRDRSFRSPPVVVDSVGGSDERLQLHAATYATRRPTRRFQ